MAVIDNVSTSNLSSEGGLNKRHVEVPFPSETFQKRRWLRQCSSDFLLGCSPRGRSLDDYVPVDTAIPETSSETLGEVLAAAKRAPRNGDDRHFIIASGKRPAK